MKKLFFFVLLLFTTNIFSQTLVSTYNFPSYNSYNGLWGITLKNDTLWVGSDFNNSTIPAKIYKITKTGVILDSMVSPKDFNHGMAWDGTGFWIAEDFRTAGARIYKINMAGAIVDSIYTGAYAGGIGGLAIEGNNLWFTVYSPESTTYPFAWAYAINTTTKLKVDSIPLRCKQAQGIAIKGDSIIYVNDNFNSEPERIFVYSRIAGDTVLSFPGPDPDGDDDPKGMVWDGQNLYLIAKRIGGTAFTFSALYKYSLTGAGSPIINTLPSSIDFGNCILNTVNSRTLTIQNTGTAILRISSFNITNTKFAISPNAADSILPGQQKNYNVTFTPTSYDTLSTTLYITSNDGGTSVKQVPLRGKGVYGAPFLMMQAFSYNFSTRRIGSTCGHLFTLKNGGSQPLTITSMPTGTSRYRLDTTGITFPIVLDSQKTKEFRVWFNPIAAATYSDSVKINSNAANGNLKLNLIGSGANSTAALGEILWEGTVPDNPYTSSDYYKPVSIKQINDVNADGINDMMVATSNYLITCYNGGSSVTADVLWTFNTGYNNNNTGSVGYEQGMQIRTDVDGDGIQDVVIGLGGGNEEVYTISGRTGKKIWEFGDSVNFSDGDVNALRVDKDYNGDGVFDVLMDANGTGGSPPGRKTIYILDGLTGAQLLGISMTNTFSYDLVNTTTGFAVGMGESGGPYAIRGYNNAGASTWNYTSPEVIWGMREIPDINGNNASDISYFLGFNGITGVLDGGTGASLYTNAFGSSIAGTMKYISDTSFVGSFPTQTFMTFFGPKQIARITTRTGTVEWFNNLDASYVCGSDIIGPMGGGLFSGFSIACGTLNNNFYILNGLTGAIQFQYSFGNGNTDFAVEKVGRLDNINRLEGSTGGSNGFEVVAGSRDGRIKCFSGGWVLPVGILTNTNGIPGKFSIEQNYPNPFNPISKIKFALPKDEFVKITIFDITGKELGKLVNEKLTAGTYETEFNGSSFASGTYFYRIEAGNFVETKKMTLIK